MRRAAALTALALYPLLAQTPTLRTTVRLVVAPTTVTDSKGRYAEGLSASDFELYDNGKRREIRAEALYEPISMVLAVQASSFSAEAINKTRRIASFIEPLLAGERGEAAVVTFDSQVRVLQQLTGDFDLVSRAMRALSPGDEGAGMIDAVLESVRMLAAQPPERRRILLLFGETRDRSSKARLAEAITAAQLNNVTVYPVTYSAYLTAFTSKPGTTPSPSSAGINIIAILREIGRLAKTNTTEALAEYTGGRRLSFNRQKSLEDALTEIGREVHSQYLLTFEAGAGEDAVYHALEVKLPRHPGLHARTRPGYWLTPPDETGPRP
ncbi:MAG TPA: VWA domain-containing protein [Bryobacteraceae bacterium]|nr:VWA domain-containing protein [Bryobacteraceae bacterium]